MKKTLKRELKLFEIVESDAFVVSVCSVPCFFLTLGLPLRGGGLIVEVSQTGNSGLAPVTKI